MNRFLNKSPNLRASISGYLLSKSVTINTGSDVSKCFLRKFLIVSELLSSKSSSANVFEFLDQIRLNDIFGNVLSLVAVRHSTLQAHFRHVKPSLAPYSC